METVVLAFSGGLDTSFCVLHLREQGYRVITVTVDTGGFSPAELAAIAARSADLGAAKHFTVDGKPELYARMVSYVLIGNILRGGVYPLCAGPERMIQASKVAEIANQEGAQAVAHGSTGAGNDQVRFDLAIRVLAPGAKIITPIRALKLTRAQEIACLESQGFAVPALSRDYSINKGVLGTTIGGKETKGSWEAPPDWVYPLVVPLEDTPDTPAEVVLGFHHGLPESLDGNSASGLEILSQLTRLGAAHGIGKDIHLGNTIIGIKGRVAFEAPGILIAVKAHRELEKLVLTKAQMNTKEVAALTYGDMLHEGQYFDPAMRDIEALLGSSQQRVTGRVRLKLFKGNVIVLGCESPYSLMNPKVATYGEENLLWDGRDAEGFCRLYGLQSVLAHRAGVLGAGGEG
jgi:argininosuccinate synthase